MDLNVFSEKFFILNFRLIQDILSDVRSCYLILNNEIN